MGRNSRFLYRLIFGVLMIGSLPVSGQIRLPKLISDGMVLQRDADLKIWGWASASEKVSVTFLDKVL